MRNLQRSLSLVHENNYTRGGGGDLCACVPAHASSREQLFLSGEIEIVGIPGEGRRGGGRGKDLLLYLASKRHGNKAEDIHIWRFHLLSSEIKSSLRFDAQEIRSNTSSCIDTHTHNAHVRARYDGG